MCLLTIGRSENHTNAPNAPHRSVSDPLQTSKGGGNSSPLGTRPLMAAAVPPHRVEMARGPPRTSSIDSAISSISAGTHSHNSSQDLHGPGSASPDIANLIQAAGSSEAVIQYLLKEKQSQTAQNTQLWRLVDKQRAMILGLNKDLERALKDKERYRKKLKESLAQLPGSSDKVSEAGSVKEKSSEASKSEEGQPAGNVEALISEGLRDDHDSHDDISHSPIAVALAPYPVTPPADPSKAKAQTLQNLVEAEHKMPAPSEHAFQQFDADAPAPGFEVGRQQRKIAEVVRELPYNASVPPSRSLPANPPPRSSASNASSSMRAPSLPVVEASSINNLGPKFPPPPRKAPPAPLNLGKTVSTSSHLHQTDSADDADSDYDDVLEVEEIPAFTERGRRKTREEDDRQRELAAQKDAELRSLSKKSNKSKSRPTTAEKGSETKGDPLPATVRQTVQISPPDAHMRHLSPSDSLTGSLAGILSASEDPDRGSQKTVSPTPLSPGLPLSPRSGLSSALPRNPRAGASQTSLASPPLSPRGMGAFPSAVPLSPRAPRQPIPLPPNTPMSMASPALKTQSHDLRSPMPLQTAKRSGEINDSPKDTGSATSGPNSIYQGFVTEEYPGLLLPPNALPSIDVRVASSRMKPSRASIIFPNKLDEDPVFTLAIFSRSNGQELWRVEKDFGSLAQLDQHLKQSPLFTARVPEKSLFSGHAPAKIDARRTALDRYFDEVLNTQMDTEVAHEICRYLSTNTMEPHADDNLTPGDSIGESPIRIGPGGRPCKNGYLTKRGKNFGGWKARFFVLDGPIFKYYEAPGGAHLGAIKLQNAQIGKQQQQSDNHSPSRGDLDEPDNQYRHAFLILEPKRKDSSSLVRHVLCAESDQERDQWVEALLQYVDYRDSEDDEGPQHGGNESIGSGQTNGAAAKKKAYGQGKALNVPEAEDSLRGISYETTAQGELPQGAKQISNSSGTPSSPTHGYDRDPGPYIPQSQSSVAISGPKNATIIQDTGAWGNKSAMLTPGFDDKVKQKKRSFFGFGSKPRGSSDIQEHANDSTSSLSQMSYEQHGPIRAVFGAPLADAIRYNHPVDANVELPAVVYRCIEYLDARNAASEEGIFRLSGSNIVIKQLRERFNNEGDVNLITDDQYYDIHAVASLLKLYLRELPTTILTRDLHLDFLAVTEVHDLQEKVRALNGLVYKLPRANNTLLRYLSSFLINIINHSDVNKMTVRNVGIVFSPTLNIPAPVFALFLQQYDGIFGSEPEPQEQAPIEVTVTAPLTPEDIRSPRKQFFQELPTPSYPQQSFPRAQPQLFPHQSQNYNQDRSVYDTGFAPIQPSYDQYPTIGGQEYGSHAPTLAGPSYDQFSSGIVARRQINGDQPTQMSKAKRRESSIFNMGVGVVKKPSNNRLNDSRTYSY
jgi:RalA-binding protein 1